MSQKKNKQYADILGAISVIVGLALIVYGLSFFIRPLMSCLSGYFLINYGLMLRGLPPLNEMFKIWFFKFRP